ncbi:MAG: hypothetical protein II912_05170 [Clostridia bacterium]|jgi:Na+-driven multidrug efflux pump|nr:hypothetical protein [Clostridia bacterium]MBR5379193.1 hypothetical protein [Clostridia bacterium]MBR5752118.1 hypothetical protein [Clostridia bacterium]
MSKKHKKADAPESVSFVNWFVTLIFSIIPGVNILFFIVCIAGARTRAKRNFAVAALVLALLLGIALSVLLFVFTDNLVDFLNGVLEKTQTLA